MKALPLAVSPDPAVSGGAAAPNGATPARKGTPQNFAAALGASSPSEPVADQRSVTRGAAGPAPRTGKSKSTASPVPAGDATATATATATGTPLPPAGNPPPPGIADMPQSASGARPGDAAAALPSTATATATSPSVASSALITAADVSTPAPGAATPGSLPDLESMFSRMLRDGIEHVPPGLSAQAQRVAGGGTAIAAAQGSEAPDRGRSSNAPVAATPAAAGETAGATPGATASGTDGTTLAVAGDSAEADAAAFAREAGRGGNSAAAAADRAGAAEAGAVAGAGAGAGGAPGGGSIQGTDATAAASVAASDVLTSAGAQTRAGISAIAAVLGGNGKHALDAAGGAAQAPGTTPDPAGASAQSGAASASVSAASAASNAGAAPPAKIDIPVTSPEFAQAVASRVSYLVDNNLNGATLQVTPPQLGPIELRVTIEAGHAQVSMSAHNPTTLDALEAGAPKLRELLSAQGFGQVSVDVSQRSFQDGSPYAQSRPWKPSSEPDAGNPAAEEPVAAARTSLGMLDAYA